MSFDQQCRWSAVLACLGALNLLIWTYLTSEELESLDSNVDRLSFTLTGNHIDWVEVALMHQLQYEIFHQEFLRID